MVYQSSYLKEEYLTILSEKTKKIIHRQKVLYLYWFLFIMFLFGLGYVFYHVPFPNTVSNLFVVGSILYLIPLPITLYLRKTKMKLQSVETIDHRVQFHPTHLILDVNAPNSYRNHQISYNNLIGYAFDEDRLYLLYRSLIFIDIDEYDLESLKKVIKLLKSKNVKYLNYLL